jgi:hypothetical protein
MARNDYPMDTLEKIFESISYRYISRVILELNFRPEIFNEKIISNFSKKILNKEISYLDITNGAFSKLEENLGTEIILDISPSIGKGDYKYSKGFLIKLNCRYQNVTKFINEYNKEIEMTNQKIIEKNEQELLNDPRCETSPTFNYLRHDNCRFTIKIFRKEEAA